MRHSVEAGSHRLYSADLVYFAAVLLRLSGIGISVNLIGSISKQLWGSIEAKSGRFSGFWEEAIGGQATNGANYLLLVWVADEGTFVWIEGAVCRSNEFSLTEGFDPDFDPTIVLSLTSVFRDVKRP